jgi:FlaA1/EpsC-like NDP-sugar epimerase
MREIFTDYAPAIVVHAAAHKHVPMMEYNPIEAIKNNVLATLTLGEIAGEFGADAFVLISTDKAVRPTSVMGATKRTAELIVQDLNARYLTRYVAVRFGNVIGSAGSVINLFREEIRRGGPVRVTHPSMVRYFMTIPEASQLVLQAAAIGRGGEIFVLDMGEPVRILDLAKDTIALSGLRPFEDIEIVFTGVRPGEKLYEELGVTGENLERTRHPKIFIGRIDPYPESVVTAARQRLLNIVAEGRPAAVYGFLREFLPEANLGAFVGPFAQASAGAPDVPAAHSPASWRGGVLTAATTPGPLTNRQREENFA